jgi:hypothetical protein
MIIYRLGIADRYMRSFSIQESSFAASASIISFILPLKRETANGTSASILTDDGSTLIFPAKSKPFAVNWNLPRVSFPLFFGVGYLILLFCLQFIY